LRKQGYERLRAFLNTGLKGVKLAWLRRTCYWRFQPDGGGAEQILLVFMPCGIGGSSSLCRQPRRSGASAFSGHPGRMSCLDAIEMSKVLIVLLGVYTA
jgi:hypothetical protein